GERSLDRGLEDEPAAGRRDRRRAARAGGGGVRAATGGVRDVHAGLFPRRGGARVRVRHGGGRGARGAGGLNSARQRPARTARFLPHGQPEEETPSEDEQAQAQKALEGESPQKAYVAEIRRRPGVAF